MWSSRVVIASAVLRVATLSYPQNVQGSTVRVRRSPQTPLGTILLFVLTPALRAPTASEVLVTLRFALETTFTLRLALQGSTARRLGESRVKVMCLCRIEGWRMRVGLRAVHPRARGAYVRVSRQRRCLSRNQPRVCYGLRGASLVLNFEP